MSKGREISDYLDDIVTSIADVEEFTKAKKEGLSCRGLTPYFTWLGNQDLNLDSRSQSPLSYH